MKKLTFQKIVVIIGAIAVRVRLLAYRRLGRQLILIKRPSGIGDIVCTLPSIACIRKNYPHAHIIYATSTPFMSLLKMSEDIDEVVESDRLSRFQKINARDVDIYYEPRLEDEVPTGREFEHLVDDFSDKIGVTLSDRQPHLVPHPYILNKMKARLDENITTGPIIAIQTGPSWAVRMWRTEEWNNLIQKLTENGTTVLQLGSDFHTETGITVADRVPGTLDWVGKLSLEETVATLSICDQFIGIDSGLLHIAGAVGTPTVGIFGPTDPVLRLPPTTPSVAVSAAINCLGCHHRLPRMHWKSGCQFDIACMRDLKSDTVYEASLYLLFQTKHWLSNRKVVNSVSQ